MITSGLVPRLFLRDLTLFLSYAMSCPPHKAIGRPPSWKGNLVVDLDNVAKKSHLSKLKERRQEARPVDSFQLAGFAEDIVHTTVVQVLVANAMLGCTWVLM